MALLRLHAHGFFVRGPRGRSSSLYGSWMTLKLLRSNIMRSKPVEMDRGIGPEGDDLVH